MFCGIAVMASTAQSEMPDSAVVHAQDVTVADTDCSNVPLAQLSEQDSVPYGSILNDGVYRRDYLYPYPSANVFYSPSFQYLTRNVVTFSASRQALAFPGMIRGNDNMHISADVDVAVYPGMMNKATGTLGASIRNGNVRFYAGGIVNEYSFYGGLIRQLGVQGSLTYQISAPLSFTAFASYYGRNAMPVMPCGSPMPPSMLGYYDVSRFGGYVNYKVSEHFGILVGGQAVERHGPRNYYEVEPIATPYVNIGSGKKKVGIGLPVGQIIYGLFGR